MAIHEKAERPIPVEKLKELYVSMLRIRLVEERIAELLQPPSEIVCPVHLYTGQEAVAVGVCADLRTDDYVFSTHRSHGHYLAKGGSLAAMFAELYGKSAGCSRGRGGSMHLAAPEVGLPGSSAIVGGTIPLAVGAGLAFSRRGQGNVAVAFFGDGATGEGVFYESLNLASLLKLPVVFVCENNLYSTHMPLASCQANTEIYRKAEAFCMTGIRVDGNDVSEVYRNAAQMIATARAGGGPALLECLTYRWRGHVGPNYDIDKGLRSQEELDAWMAACPVARMETDLIGEGVLTPNERETTAAALKRDIEDAIKYARECSYPGPTELAEGVFKG